MIRLLALSTLVLLTACLSPARRQAPAQATPPAKQAPETGPDIDLLHHLRRSTVSLGLHITENGQERFATIGSGVLVAWDEHHGCLLTAKHLFYNPERSFFPTVIYLRLPQSEPRAQDDLGVKISLVDNGKSLWRGSSDADLAVVELPDLSSYKDLHAILLTDFGGEDDVFQGAPVVVMGYPELLGPEFQKTPIARNGIVAWTDPNGRTDQTFLVDANVFNGNSGGPVFRMPTGLNRNGGFNVGGTPKLIGIVSKDAYEEAQVHVGEAPITVTNQQTGVTIPMQARILNIGGIGVVEPISKAKKLIIETFNLPIHP